MFEVDMLEKGFQRLFFAVKTSAKLDVVIEFGILFHSLALSIQDKVLSD